MVTKQWWGRGAAALLATSLWLQAPALAVAPPEPLGTLTPQEEKEREEFRKALKELPTVEQLSKNPFVTGGLDMLIPGAGEVYHVGTGDLTPGVVRGATILGADLLAIVAVSLLTINLGSEDRKIRENQTNLAAGISVAAVHLLLGGVGGFMKTKAYNDQLPAALAVAEKDLKENIAALDTAEQGRAELAEQRRVENRKRNITQAKALASQKKYGLALMQIQSRTYDEDTEIVALRAEITAALDEAKARDQAYRLKKGRELLDKIFADAARYAAQRDYEHALALLEEVPDTIPAAWMREVTQRANQYRQAEARAGGREKLRQERQNAVKQQLFAAIRRGDRPGAIKELDEFNTLATSGMMGGRGFLLSEGATKIQKGSLGHGEIMLIQGRVETVLPGGVMLRVQDPIGGTMSFLAQAHGIQTNERVTRVFVKTRNMGVVDGDTVMLGVQVAGTYSYTTVAGGRGTVRVVDLKTRLQ